MNLKESKRLIVKVGSRLLIDEEKQQFNMPWLVSLIADLAQLIRQGVQLILVTSGSVACGNIALGLTRSKTTLDQKQAAAAVGQIQLIHTYQTLLNQQGLKCAQVLLTMEDSENRRRYINLRNTLECLLHFGVIPIINENDSVTTAEIKYGDNDRLSARVVQMVDADTLVLLSDIDGLYTSDPHKDKQAKFIPLVTEITPEIAAMGQDSINNYGSGGMRTKIAAAEIATSSGCRLLICAGRMMHPLQNYQETQRGTWFLPEGKQLRAKQSWLKQHLKPKGKLQIDDGAVKALRSGKSLLPIGVKAVEGRFDKGDPISIVDTNGVEMARGLINYSNEEVQKILGKTTEMIVTLLNYPGTEEVVHRNNLVILKKESQ